MDIKLVKLSHVLKERWMLHTIRTTIRKPGIQLYRRSAEKTNIQTHVTCGNSGSLKIWNKETARHLSTWALNVSAGRFTFSNLCYSVRHPIINQKILTDRTTVLSWWGKTNTSTFINVRTMTHF